MTCSQSENAKKVEVEIYGVRFECRHVMTTTHLRFVNFRKKIVWIVTTVYCNLSNMHKPIQSNTPNGRNMNFSCIRQE